MDGQNSKLQCQFNEIAVFLILQEFACNGTVVEHPEYGEVIQLQGDQRNAVCVWLLAVGLAKKDQLKVHGF